MNHPARPRPEVMFIDVVNAGWAPIYNLNRR
jgi:hypothetical protein